MKTKMIQLLTLFTLFSFVSCSQDNEVASIEKTPVTTTQKQTPPPGPHRYGGWYCPDNLNGFPAVDIANWKDVPVVRGRMATREDTKTESALIFVDPEKHPKAFPLDMATPQLATYFNHYSKREDLVIIIQAINIDNDSIVGFRYLNGGNGSARLSEVNILSEFEAAAIPTSRFITMSIDIDATQEEVWGVLQEEKDRQYIFLESSKQTSVYADLLFGNFYIQNDYDQGFTEKFMLIEDQQTHRTELRIVCGPYLSGFEDQKKILKTWGEFIKKKSEKGKC